MSFSSADPLTVIKADLERIHMMLEQGWHVLGWKNQGTGNDYAIGGGVAGLLSPVINGEIQSTLHSFAKKYTSQE